MAENEAMNTRPQAIEPYDKVWGVGVSGLDDSISPFTRINSMLEKTKNVSSRVDTERAEILTESYEKYKGEPQMIKVAKAFRDVLSKVTIHIDEEELIVGEIAAPAWHAPLYPDFSIQWLVEEMDDTSIPDFSERSNDRYIVSEENRKVIREIAPKWEGVSNVDLIKKALTKEEASGSTLLGNGMYANDLYSYNGIGHVSVDYPTLLKNGFGGLKKKVEEKLAGLVLGSSPEATKQREFWQAQLISLEGAMTYFKRYSRLAATMAEECKDADRKKELERISANCEWVAEKPARDFWEAAQLWWLATNLILIESNGHSVTYGRFDQIMGPYYEYSIKENILTREFMQELIECSFIKMDQLRKIRCFGETIIASGIGWGGTALNVGGVDAAGNDAVNDVSYMVLDAHAHTRITNPWMGVRLSNKNPKEFWTKTFNVIRIGTGEPKIYNDDKVIESMLNYGVPMEQARNWVGIGCVEPEVPGFTYGWHDADYFNTAKVLSFALNGGRDPATGEQAGPDNGTLADFKSFDEVKKAFEIQLKYWIDCMVSTLNTMDLVHQKNKPLPYLSLLVNDCIDKGQDISSGGARYNYTGPQCVGLGTVADSLTTIKQLVFEEKKVTGEELMKALKADWKGYEALQAYVNSDQVHHYGNDDDYADEMAQYVMNKYCEFVEHRPNARGGEFRPGVYSVSINVPCGMGCTATPDGRVSGEPVSDCLGPAHPGGVSHDVKGPMAVADSLAKLDQARIANGVILNWKFTPDTLSGDTGLDNFMNLMQGYFYKGGMQSQFNVTSKDVLQKAQQTPKKYKDLMVRVAGYSAFFTELSQELQSDLIGRTELSF
ncbi:MAG: formate C-acetyltransferase/glycerol dehydratase family glycyl radical enzyme [Eubacterium sp.]|nr:formate C-acetyltransferase/glycerol dehydratase family glycyl radical enzyme [Eubacterium sp.]